MALTIVVMAAGKGTRMKSAQPKVLHTLAGSPLLQHVLDTAAALDASRIVVVTGHGAAAVEAAVHAPRLSFVRQNPQLGTGHAVQQAAEFIDDGATLILNGDVPLIRADTIRSLVEACGETKLALLTVDLADPTGYGRVIRGDPAGRDAHEGGRVRGIVEHKDATTTQRAIREVYTGVMAAPGVALKRWLAALSNDNAQGEYYLTDVVAMAVADGVPIVTARPSGEDEVLGVNSPSQLADLERRYQRARAESLMEAGVRLADPARFDVRGELACGRDVSIDVNCIFEGRVILGDDVRIGANCVLRDATVDAGATLQPFTHVEGAKVGRGAIVGPFARLRPGADLGEEVHVGNFVEIKNSTLGRRSKANHLAYLGDATVGERVNYGAGSITANYDGANKHRTVIGDDVHIGSNSVLVAPVRIGDGATVGGGSTVVKDAPAGELTVARARQVSLKGWKRPVKRK
jgi:bifunctional UDP-N-acetylglucosamine pyrophosphorylase/glucosamine-1-phosphate N-acetyltransferase